MIPILAQYGIVITDKSNPLQAAAYTLGLASIGAGEAAWQVANPTASAPVDIEDEAGSFAWAFVYPSDVCDFMPLLNRQVSRVWNVASFPDAHGSAITLTLQVWLYPSLFITLRILHSYCVGRWWHMVSAPVVHLLEAHPSLPPRGQRRDRRHSPQCRICSLAAKNGLPETFKHACHDACKHDDAPARLRRCRDSW